MPSFNKVTATLFAVLATYLLIWYSWIGGHQLVLTVAIMGVGVWAVARVQAWAPAAGLAVVAPATAPPPVPAPAEAAPEKAASSAWGAMGLGLVGLACAGGAYRALLAEHWALAVTCLGAGALAWRSGLPLRLPTLSRGALALLLLLAVGTGAAFRLYKAGEVPVGFDSMDEAALKMMDQTLVSGDRPTMFVMPGVTGDGTLPHYLAALSMRVFGDSMFGFRMSAVLIGILITFIIFHVGKDKGDPWLGLAVASLWAVCVWPVSISRAHYLLIETHMVVLACLALTVKALEKDRPLYFALAGFAWAFTLQVYHAAQVMLVLLPLLLFLAWYLQPKRRGVIARGLAPLLGGLLVGLGPMLLWAWTDPKGAYVANFGVLYASHIGGAPASYGPLTALDNLLGRAIPMFPTTWKMFTVRGPFQAYFFPALQGADAAFPVFDQSVVFLFLVGASVCIARFRRPYFAFLLFWWAAALLPGLISNPGSQPDDRRGMMIMPPMLMLAALGLVTSMDFLLRAVPQRLKVGAFVAVGLAYFAYLTPVSWHDYFARNQGNSQLLNYAMANTTAQGRAIYEEGKHGPVVLISTQGLNFDSWNQPNYDPFNKVYPALCPFPTQYAQHFQDYFIHDGLFSSLKWALEQPADASGKKPDILVALTPFHFYLEPLLQKLGGRTVREVPLVQSNQGPVLQGVGMAPAVHGVSLKLVRLPNQIPALAGLREGSLFNFTAEELLPPDGVSREAMGQENSLGPAVKKQMLDYQAHPGRWRSQKTVAFRLPDPFFWMTPGNLPGNILPPLRMRVSFQVDIKAAGLYAFGASATPYTALKLDGRPVFTFVPAYDEALASELWNKERDGMLGQPVELKAGIHRLDAEQVWLSAGGNYNHVFRLQWKAPGGEQETLPLDVLQPVAAKR